MSIALLPAAPSAKADFEEDFNPPSAPISVPRGPRLVRRRASRQQGRALEALGHAVEYLVDSRMFGLGLHDERAEQEAIQILMRMSRAVFAECPELIPVRERLGRWVSHQVVGLYRIPHDPGRG